MEQRYPLELLELVLEPWHGVAVCPAGGLDGLAPRGLLALISVHVFHFVEVLHDCVGLVPVQPSDAVSNLCPREGRGGPAPPPGGHLNSYRTSTVARRGQQYHHSLAHSFSIIGIDPWVLYAPVHSCSCMHAQNRTAHSPIAAQTLP